MTAPDMAQASLSTGSRSHLLLSSRGTRTSLYIGFAASSGSPSPSPISHLHLPSPSPVLYLLYHSIRGRVVINFGLLIAGRCQVECAGDLGQALYAGFDTAVFMQ
jgi:hypothetical protein